MRKVAFIATVFSGIGGFVFLLDWLGIHPKDFAVTLPHSALLIGSIILFFVCIASSGYSLYESLRNPRRVIQEVVKEVPVRRQLSPGEVAQIQKAGALNVLADEADRLVSQLKQNCRWLDDNQRLQRHQLAHPLDESFRTQVGVGNWTHGHDNLTTFQDDFKAHQAYIAKEFPHLETAVTKLRERYATSRELDEARVLEILTSHSSALRAEASRILEAFRS